MLRSHPAARRRRRVSSCPRAGTFILPPAKKPIDWPSGDQNGPPPFWYGQHPRGAGVNGLSQMALRRRGRAGGENDVATVGEMAGDSSRICHWSGRSTTTLASSRTGPAARRNKPPATPPRTELCRTPIHATAWRRGHLAIAAPDHGARSVMRGVVCRNRLVDLVHDAVISTGTSSHSRGVESSRRIAASSLNRSAPHAIG